MKIAVFTQLEEGFGDYYGAYKLITAILGKYPDAEISWVVKNISSQRYDFSKLHLQNVKRYIEAYNSTTTQLDSSNKFDFIFVYPTPGVGNHFKKTKLDERGIDTTSWYFSLGEYDSGNAINTGFGKDALGIFVDNHLKLPREELINKLSDETRELIQKHGIDMDEFFFGYFTMRRADNSPMCASSYLILIAQLMKESRKDTIDVIANCVYLRDEGVIDNLKKQGIAKVILLNNKGQKEIIEIAGNGKTLRVFDFFPLQNHDDMLFLMELSHWLVGCTGDQSFSECLSIGKVPFYQSLNIVLLRNFITFAKENLINDSQLFNYINLLEGDNRTGAGVKLLENMAKYLKEVDLNEMASLTQKLKKEKSLADNVHRLLDYTKFVDGAGDADSFKADTLKTILNMGGGLCLIVFMKASYNPRHDDTEASLLIDLLKPTLEKYEKTRKWFIEFLPDNNTKIKWKEILSEPSYSIGFGRR